MLDILISVLLTSLFSISGTGVYNSQTQQARDTERIMDLQNLKLAVSQYYNDNNSEYPTKLSDELIKVYLKNTIIPVDELEGQVINGCEFGYTYEVFDRYGMPNQGYRLSTCLESEKNIKTKAMTDGGIYDNKYEIGDFIREESIPSTFDDL